jgi:hypothetical protein
MLTLKIGVLFGMLEEDEDFQAKIQDTKVMTFSAIGKEKEWRGMRCVS